MSLALEGDAVYLDYAASTPPAPEVCAAMAAALGTLPAANPTALHAAGRRAAAQIDAARAQLAALLNAPPRSLVWTSGATESNNLAISGAAHFRAHRGRHLVTMRTEHKAVSDVFRALEKDGFEVSWLDPDEHGVLSLDRLRHALRDDTQLVSVMHVNNETGVIQDIRGIAALCRERDVLYHCDAAQSVGKLPLDLAAMPVDLLSLTGHKFYGPQGIGALYIAEHVGSGLCPLFHGGGQERRLRPGTLPVHQIAGIGIAAELAAARQDADRRHLETLHARMWAGLERVEGIHLNGSPDRGSPAILNVGVDGIDGESLVLALEPLCVSRGAACNSLDAEPSGALRALGRSEQAAQSAIRFSFGRQTTVADIDNACERYRRAVRHLRNVAPARDPAAA